MNHPIRIQFTNGNVTEFIYASTGEKLRTVHRTAVNNISVPIGCTLTLTTASTLSVDSTDYIGNFLFENGKTDKYLFNGGYCSFTSTGLPIYHYYTQDHLGNNRAVINENGTLEQVTHYYPFGGIYGDTGVNTALRPYKYNGKELDRMHGLDWYDYGARSYDPALGRFTAIDPLAEKYYKLNPYVYCRDNPVNAIDPDGKETQYFLLLDDKSNYNYSIVEDNMTMTNVLKAINIIKQTDYGSNFFNSFEKGGVNFAYKLDIYTQHFKTKDNLGQVFGNSDLDYDDENDRIKFELTVDDSERSVGEILQTICHEISDHLNTPNINSVIDLFKKNGKGKNGFDKAYDLFNTDSAHKQHRQQDKH